MNQTYLLAAGLPLVSAIFSAAFFCLWLIQKTQRYILNWSICFACGLIGSGLGLGRLFLPESDLFPFLGNGFLLGMAYFACRGVLVRHTARSFDTFLLPICAVTLLATLWFGFISPDIFARGTSVSLGAATIIAIAAWKMLQCDNLDVIDYLIAAALGATSISLIARPLLVYFLGGIVSSEAEVIGSWWGVSFRILGTASVVSVAVLLLCRLASDLISSLKVQARTDHLTGVLNRGGFFAQAEATNLHNMYAVILCDIDEFKVVNDTYGHKAGDTVIQGLAKVLTEVTAPYQPIVGRLGGEEFIVLLLDIGIVQARELAEEIRIKFAATSHEGVAPSHAVTLSAGVAAAFGSECIDSVINHADMSLYRAKQNGRNCVESTVQSSMDVRQTVAEVHRRRRLCA